MMHYNYFQLPVVTRITLFCNHFSLIVSSNMSGRKKSDIWKFFPENAEGRYVCGGCHNFSVGPNGRVSYLQARFINCVPLREMMQKDSDSRSLSLKKSTWSANGSILEWIRDTQHKWMNQCARIAWRKSQMGWHDFGETRNKEPKVEPNLFLFTFRSAKTTSNSMYDVAI